MTPIVHGLSGLVSGIDILLVDVWGVLHNGLAPHPAAGEALARFRRGGGFVTLVSNAPRESARVVEFLDGLGVTREAYDAVVTSGDITRTMLAQGKHRTLAYFGPDRDRSLFANLPLRETPIADAEIVLCAGLDDDETETPADYAGRLAECRARALPMICANPDLVVERGPRLIWCAGAIAEDYEKIGGAVAWTGKPHGMIYDAALDIAALSRRAPADRGRVMAIGDAIRTDVAGAHRLGVRSLMIADGIHARDLLGEDGQVDAAKAELFLGEAAFRPTAIAARLAW
ncbi:MAG: TIGR01459 family HAD-type hydrolase [Rhizobiales bacterium]|nr:TIGR01459 family HAD-type hydrolase [Hyphomicrobiales bacterium]